MNACFFPSFATAIRVVSLLVAALVVAGCAQRDMTDLQQFVETTKRTTPVKKPDPPPEIKPYTPFTYTAQGVKDPFIVAPFAQEEELELTQALAAQPSGSYTGVRPDPNRVREELEKYSLGRRLKLAKTKLQGNFMTGCWHRVPIWY